MGGWRVSDVSWETLTKVYEAIKKGQSLFVETMVPDRTGMREMGVAQVEGLQVTLQDRHDGSFLLRSELRCRNAVPVVLKDDTRIAWSEVEAMNWQAERFRQLIEQAKAMGINVAEEGNDLRPA